MYGPYKHVCKDGSIVWKCQYTDWQGRRVTFTGNDDKRWTRDQAKMKEQRQKEIRSGNRPKPKTSDTARDFMATVQEYLAAGKANGGRNGFPWAASHAKKRERDLTWWKDKAALETVADLEDCLPRAEKALQELHKQGRAGKTLVNTAEALKSFAL